jgi:hypothetical protein
LLSARASAMARYLRLHRNGQSGGVDDGVD